MSSNAKITTGTTITFGTSSFTAEILGVGMDGIERPDIDVSHLGTEDAREFKPGKLYDPGGLSLDIQYTPGTKPPIDAEPETITVAFADGGSVSFSGYVNAFNFEGELEDKWTGTVGVKASGVISFSAGS